jgi:alkylation response protein AidB-like acyl-CoA dehydrogenase
VSTTAAELAELRDALRRALGTTPDAVPSVDREWRARWPELAGIGVLAFCVPGAAGGFGFEVPAALVASRELGAALHASPYAAAVTATFLLARDEGGDGPVEGGMVDGVLTGEHVSGLAFLDPGAVVTTTAAPRVTGRARLVAGAEDCDSFVLLAPDRPEPLLVHAGAGCTVGRIDDFDASRSFGDLVFAGAPVRILDVPAGARATAERLHGLLLAGDALGGVEAAHARTTAYARERRAFGKVIGGFQAVQHRLVDHAVRIRGLSLLAGDAAGRLAAGAPGADRQSLLAEAGAAGHALNVLHDLLQLTGAIAFTWEYGLHLYERRVHLDARLGHNPRQALRALVACEGW